MAGPGYGGDDVAGDADARVAGHGGGLRGAGAYRGEMTGKCNSGGKWGDVTLAEE